MSPQPKPDATFNSANPHALAVILEASETKRIIAATDIFDISGIKLWARDQPVSATLQRKLLDRQLRQPLESCLVAEDGVTSVTLAESLLELLKSETPLAPVLRAQGARLVREVGYLPLHPVVQLLLTACETARPEAYDHAVAAMALAGALAAGGGAETAGVRLAMLGGLLHDLGKIGVPDSILQAPRALTAAEFEAIKAHPALGYTLLEGLNIAPVDEWVLHHHENWDGTGYPDKLAGDEIPLGARIIRVADAFEAMTADRPYRAAQTVDYALEELRLNAGTEFDPATVAALEMYVVRGAPQLVTALA